VTAIDVKTRMPNMQRRSAIRIRMALRPMTFAIGGPHPACSGVLRRVLGLHCVSRQVFTVEGRRMAVGDVHDSLAGAFILGARWKGEHVHGCG